MVLDERVRERTAKLETAKSDFERFKKHDVGRELKMIELKKRIVELEKKTEVHAP